MSAKDLWRSVMPILWKVLGCLRSGCGAAASVKATSEKPSAEWDKWFKTEVGISARTVFFFYFSKNTIRNGDKSFPLFFDQGLKTLREMGDSIERWLEAIEWNTESAWPLSFRFVEGKSKCQASFFSWLRSLIQSASFFFFLDHSTFVF
jgi:hypothetical protein